MGVCTLVHELSTLTQASGHQRHQDQGDGVVLSGTLCQAGVAPCSPTVCSVLVCLCVFKELYRTKPEQDRLIISKINAKIKIFSGNML